MKKINAFNELEIWQKSVELAGELHKLSIKTVVQDSFGIVSLMHKNALTLTCVIADGFGTENIAAYENAFKEVKKKAALIERLCVFQHYKKVLQTNEINGVLYLLHQIKTLLQQTIADAKARKRKLSLAA